MGDGFTAAADRDYFTVFDWMIHPEGLGLRVSSAQCPVYARIYGASHHGSGASMETQGHLAEVLGLSRQSVNSAVASLLSSGLIVERGVVGPKGTGIKLLAAAQAPIDAAIERCAAVRQAGVEGAGTGWELVRPTDSFPQSAAQDLVKKLDKVVKNPDNLVKKVDKVVKELDKVATCGDARAGEESRGGGAGASSAANDVYINKNKLNKNNSFNSHSHTKGVDPSGREATLATLPEGERRALGAILASSPRHVDAGHLPETVTEWRRLVDGGADPTQIEEAWKSYLEWFYSPERPAEEKDLRYVLFPANFFRRPQGWLRWRPAGAHGRDGDATPRGGGGPVFRKASSGGSRVWLAGAPGAQMDVVCSCDEAPSEEDARRIWAESRRRAETGRRRPEAPKTATGDASRTRGREGGGRTLSAILTAPETIPSGAGESPGAARAPDARRRTGTG